jgi:hypothetical protein
MTKTTKKKIPRLYKYTLSSQHVAMLLQHIPGLNSELVDQLTKCKGLAGPHTIMMTDPTVDFILDKIRFLTFVTNESTMYKLISLANALEGIEDSIF